MIRETNHFCWQKWQWTVANEWSSVIFNDETKIMIGNNNRIYVWIKVTRDQSAFVSAVTERQHVLHMYVFGDASSSMEWVIKGNMNSDKFIDVSLASSS